MMFSLCGRSLSAPVIRLTSTKFLLKCAPITHFGTHSVRPQCGKDRPKSFELVDKKVTNFDHRSLRYHSTIPRDFAVARTQLMESIKEIKIADAKNAPVPIFWSGVAGLIPIVIPPLTFLLFGYSQPLATVQMTFAATISAFLSGTKYGTHVSHTDTAQWPNVVASIAPQFISFTGLLLPEVIGFPLIASAIAVNGFIDLTSGPYPPWFKALRLGLTVPVLLSLFLTCVFKLFDAMTFEK